MSEGSGLSGLCDPETGRVGHGKGNVPCDRRKHRSRRRSGKDGSGGVTLLGLVKTRGDDSVCESSPACLHRRWRSYAPLTLARRPLASARQRMRAVFVHNRPLHTNAAALALSRRRHSGAKWSSVTAVQVARRIASVRPAPSEQGCRNTRRRRRPSCALRLPAWPAPE